MKRGSTSRFITPEFRRSDLHQPGRILETLARVGVGRLGETAGAGLTC
jgi:hypothetical protein